MRAKAKHDIVVPGCNVKSQATNRRLRSDRTIPAGTILNKWSHSTQPLAGKDTLVLHLSHDGLEYVVPAEHFIAYPPARIAKES